MKDKTVKDIMLPIEEYAVVSEEATIVEALRALDEAQIRLPAGRQPHRMVLVKSKEGKIVGKLGHQGFLAALEPKYKFLGDVEKMSSSSVSVEFLEKMMDDLGFWEEKLEVACRRAQTTRMKEVMKPRDEAIDESKSLTEAIHRMIMWQRLSLLVTRGDKVVGVVRMVDLFSEVARYVKAVG